MPVRRTRRRAAASEAPGSEAVATDTATEVVASSPESPAEEAASAAVEEGQEVASAAADEGREVASEALGEGQEVVEAARQDAAEVAEMAKEEASEVQQEVVMHGRGLLEETRSQLEEQAQTQVAQLAQALRQYGSQAEALADGRPSQAGPLPAYIRDASSRLERWADDIDARGVDGLLYDVQAFARRRPGVFLLGAAAAGFGIGRLIRARSSDDGEAPSAAPPQQVQGGATTVRTVRRQVRRPPGVG
ncbi:MAG: hypothetical protein M3N31_01270 [Actinomycetota bacterium]|nr:hypothetical protein [Actinomycetota bacterium]